MTILKTNHESKILVFGRDGQVGHALKKYFEMLNLGAIFLGRLDCDISESKEIVGVLKKYKPQIIINAAAYTNVDEAEKNEKITFLVNAAAPKVMANYIANIADGVFIHYSSDYVFSGASKCPYTENDCGGPVDTLSKYGASKLTGEINVKEAFDTSTALITTWGSKNNVKSSRYYILRTSWVYGFGDNFIAKVIKMIKKGGDFKIVVDQVGVPTSARWLAEVTTHLLFSKAISGTYHAVPNGMVSRHALAEYIYENMMNKQSEMGLKPVTFLPVSSTAYKAAARRPYNSCMSNAALKKILLKIDPHLHYPNWSDQVSEYLESFLIAK